MQTSALPGAVRPVPPALLGRPVALLASGPSLTPRQVWEASQAGFALVGCNNQCIYALDVLWVPDHAWLDAIEPRVGHIPERWTTLTPAQRNSARHPARRRADWSYLDTDPNIAFSFDLTVLARNFHAGAQLINLAVLMGAKHLALFGYDGQTVDGERHWFGSHPPGPLDRASAYDRFNGAYPAIASALDSAGVECVNVTEASAIAAFPRARYQDVLSRWGG